jgi:hypothetical protein
MVGVGWEGWGGGGLAGVTDTMPPGGQNPPLLSLGATQ